MKKPTTIPLTGKEVNTLRQALSDAKAYRLDLITLLIDRGSPGSPAIPRSERILRDIEEFERMLGGVSE